MPCVILILRAGPPGKLTFGCGCVQDKSGRYGRKTGARGADCEASATSSRYATEGCRPLLSRGIEIEGDCGPLQRHGIAHLPDSLPSHSYNPSGAEKASAG